MEAVKLNPVFGDLNPVTIKNHIEGLQKTIKNEHQNIREKYKIDVNEDVPPPQIAWCLKNQKDDSEAILGTLGDFGLIIGKAKSRKSFFVNIAVSAALSKDLILNRFKSYLPPNKNEVVYFDTEQSKYYVLKAVKRICAQINEAHPRNLHTYHLRSLNPLERLQFIENEIYLNNRIGFVIIDGIKDLVTSINDESEATMIASKLLKWSEERNIYILTVLHQNKSDNNARGHIGTELINKAQTVLSVTKDEQDNDISIVEPQQCRDKEPETFAFEIDGFGIPVIAENFEIRTESRKNRFDIIRDFDDDDKRELLSIVFKNGQNFTYTELRIQMQLAYKKIYSKNLADNKAKELITYCKNEGWLNQEKPKAPYNYYETKV